MSFSFVSTTEWDELFTTLGNYLKAFAAQQWPLLDDGSGSDAYVSLHRLYAVFPVPADILLLDSEGIDSPRKQRALCHSDTVRFLETQYAGELSSLFAKMSDGKPLTLAERHASVASIQLIPQVPGGVRRTFGLAKHLYVYGHLECGFFAVSLHYAHLALDAALHARWSATLPAPVLLTLHKKKKVEKQETMHENPQFLQDLRLESRFRTGGRLAVPLHRLYGD